MVSIIDICIIEHLSLRSASAEVKVIILEKRNQYGFKNIAIINHL